MRGRIALLAGILLALVSIGGALAAVMLGSSPAADSVPAATSTTKPSALPFVDDFRSLGSGWEIGTYDAGSLEYGPGYYRIQAVEEDMLMEGVAGKSFRDVAIDVDALQVSAPADNNNSYGIFCRAQDNDDGYLLRVSGDGMAAITRILNDEFVDLVPWQEVAAVHPGNAQNHLRAVCDGTRIALYVNGSLVAETDDASFSQGDVGLSATSYEAEPTEIRFMNLAVTPP